MFLLQTSSSSIRFAILFLLAAALGCGGDHREGVSAAGGGEKPEVSSAAAPPADSEKEQQLSKKSENRSSFDWEDPEPPEAQSLAESVVNEPFNRNKTTSLDTTLVDRRTGIVGFATKLENDNTNLEDRLEALGAEQTETEITIRLKGSILFDFNSAAIRADAERSLKEVISLLRPSAGARPIPSQTIRRPEGVRKTAGWRSLSRNKAQPFVRK